MNKAILFTDLRTSYEFDMWYVWLILIGIACFIAILLIAFTLIGLYGKTKMKWQGIEDTRDFSYSKSTIVVAFVAASIPLATCVGCSIGYSVSDYLSFNNNFYNTRYVKQGETYSKTKEIGEIFTYELMRDNEEEQGEFFDDLGRYILVPYEDTPEYYMHSPTIRTNIFNFTVNDPHVSLSGDRITSFSFQLIARESIYNQGLVDVSVTYDGSNISVTYTFDEPLVDWIWVSFGESIMLQTEDIFQSMTEVPFTTLENQIERVKNYLFAFTTFPTEILSEIKEQTNEIFTFSYLDYASFKDYSSTIYSLIFYRHYFTGVQILPIEASYANSWIYLLTLVDGNFSTFNFPETGLAMTTYRFDTTYPRSSSSEEWLKGVDSAELFEISIVD